ncbi:MAG: hypothetical protein AB1649_27050 [Chloroflexota bacterium]
MMTDSNISFQYLYRDASNYKLHGEAIFTNTTGLSIEELEKRIRTFLKDGEFFIARQVHIEECFFDALDDQDDHPWHEFAQVTLTNEPPWDPDGIPERDITDFLAEVEKAHSQGWDETNVRADVKRLLERQKEELKAAFEEGRDILNGDDHERSQP